MTIDELKIHPWLSSKPALAPAIASAGDSGQEGARLAKRRRRLSRKSSVEDSLWTNEDNDRVSSAIAEVTSMMQDSTRESSRGRGRGGVSMTNGAGPAHRGARGTATTVATRGGG